MPTIVILALILDYSVWVVVRGVRRRRAGQGGCCGCCGGCSGCGHAAPGNQADHCHTR